MFKKFCPDPHSRILINDAEVNQAYVYWRRRLTYALLLGYACFYCVRQNFSLVVASKAFPFTAESMGWGFSLFSIVYGGGKFISGMLCDRLNVRHIMALGLLGAALTSICAGFVVKSALVMGCLYAANACFQSFGAPSVARSLTQWFGPKEIGTRYGILNASHQIGSVVILIGGAWLIQSYSWQHVFIVPGVCCVLAAFWLWERLRNSPQSLGLPSIEEKEGIEKAEPLALFTAAEKEQESWWLVFKTHIIFNFRLWMVCLAKFFVYFVRMGYFFWGPKIIAETQGGTLIKASYKTAAFELAGIFGGLLAGWYTDKHMPHRRGIYGVFIMFCLAFILTIYLLLLRAGLQSSAFFNPIDTFFWWSVGFFVYSSQALGGLLGTEFGSRKAAATAFGLTGLSAYLGAGVVGIGVPKIARYWGWEAVYVAFILASLGGGLFFALSLLKTKQIKSI